MPVSVLVRIKRPMPWRNFRMASGSENSMKELPPARFDGFDARLDQRMVRHGKGQARDDDVGKRFARHIHPLPKAVGAEEDGIDVAS